MINNSIIKKRGEITVILMLIAFLVVADIFARSQQTISAMVDNDSKSGSYIVRMLQISPPKFAVTANLPINGKTLQMERTRPIVNIPEVDAKGWTALVRHLRVKDKTNKSIEVKNVGSSGWELAEPKAGRLTIEYEVDYSLLAENNFPAPREAAFADADHFVTIGRALFITTPETNSITVSFGLPSNWNAAAPWTQITKSNNSFSVSDAKDLTENLIVFSRLRADTIKAGNFHLSINALGHWQDARGDVKQVLQKVVPFFVRFIKAEETVNYSLVLLPGLEERNAGESYRNSFAFSVKEPPSKANRADWGQFIGHEIFHYWNGWRLRGADYAASQWFQEGFTQYIADLAMVSSGLTSPDDFRQRISGHIKNYRNLTTALENPGSRKGPPLYSGGALVALCWDIRIRHATGGKRNLGDFFRTLWRKTDNAKREYDWSDIKTALENTAPLDWEAFFLAHIRGTEKLPLDEILPQAGLRLVQVSDGSVQVEFATDAQASSKSLWNKLINGR